jgi:hypothetical protein
MNNEITVRPRCSCGKSITKAFQAAGICKACSIAKSDLRYAAVRTIVAAGICPTCGSKLRRNLALTGWWQCAQYGAEGFRADSSKPACSWQDFTS